MGSSNHQIMGLETGEFDLVMDTQPYIQGYYSVMTVGHHVLNGNIVANRLVVTGPRRLNKLYYCILI